MTTTTSNMSTLIKYDPTRTTFLRNAFASDMKVRFKELKKAIYKGVYLQDCFGLKGGIETNQLSVPGVRSYSFLSNPEKVEAFMKWLKLQEEKGLISVGEVQQIGNAINKYWTNKYVFDSYKRGVLRARQELLKAKYDVPSVEGSGGADSMLMIPIHLDLIGMLYTRVFTLLQGITAQMDTVISQVLSQGIIDGDGPALLAKKLLSVIDGNGLPTLGITDSLGRFIPAERRAVILARTEVIRTFHQASIQEYRNWGLEGVQVQAEWITAGDDRVCPTCASMEGKIFTLDEIEPLIPFHPQCRCIAIPVLKNN